MQYFLKNQSSPSQQTNATPFNAKYLLGSGQDNNNNSVTPAGKNQPFTEFQDPKHYSQHSNSGHFGLGQNLNQSQSSNSIKNTRISPLKALKNSYQQKIDLAKQQNQNMNQNDKTVNESGQKSQSPLRKSLIDEFEDMKSKIAFVQSQLPESIKPRSCSLKGEQAQGPNSENKIDNIQDNQIVQIPLFQQVQQRSKMNAQSLFIPKNPEKFKRSSVKSNENEIQTDSKKEENNNGEQLKVQVDQNKLANLKQKLQNQRMQQNEIKHEQQKEKQQNSDESDDVNFNDNEMDNMDEELYEKPISQIEDSCKRSEQKKCQSRNSVNQSKKSLDNLNAQNDKSNQQNIETIKVQEIPTIVVEQVDHAINLQKQKSEMKRFKSQTLEPISLNLKNVSNEENQKPISEKSLNKREELIIKYRIESDNYNQLDNSKSLKSARIMECVNLLYNAKGEKDKREKESQKNEEKSKFLQSMYQQQPQKQKIHPERLKDFIQRQQNFEKKKQEEIQKMKEDAEFQKQKELIFYPNILKTQKQQPRNIEQFINDQNRFKARVESNIESLRKIKLQEEKKIMKRPVSNTSKRNKSKQQIRNNKQKSESSSQHSDSMDEGLQPVFQKQKYNKLSDDDDIDEHVDSNKKNMNVHSNQIGVGNIQSSPNKLLLNTRSNPYIVDQQAKLNQYYSMSKQMNKASISTQKTQQPSFNAGSSINSTYNLPISSLPQNNQTVFQKMNVNRDFTQYNQSQRIPQNNFMFQNYNQMQSQSFQQNQNSPINVIVSNLNSLSKMNPFKKQEVPQSNNFNKLWENNSNQNFSPPLIQSSQNAHIKQKIITKVEIEEPFSSSDEFSSSQSNNISNKNSIKKSFYDRKDSQKSKKSEQRSSSVKLKKEKTFVNKNKQIYQKKKSINLDIGIFDMDEKKLCLSKSVKDKLKQKYIRNSNSARIKNKNAYEHTNVVSQTKNFLNKNSNKIVNQKFEKEFYQCIHDILKEEEIPDKIDSYTFTQLMIQLGCARKVDMENDRTIEFKKIEELWLCLQKIALHPLNLININGQHSDDEVLVEDVKTFLMAVLGIQQNFHHSSTDNDKDLKEFQSKMFPNYTLPYGYLVNSKEIENKNRKKENLIIKLTNSCQEQIRQKFTILNSNRMNWLGEILDKKKLNEQLKQRFDFRPQLLASATSHQLIKNKSEKIFKRIQKSQSEKKFDIKKQQDTKDQYFQISNYNQNQLKNQQKNQNQKLSPYQQTQTQIKKSKQLRNIKITINEVIILIIIFLQFFQEDKFTLNPNLTQQMQNESKYHQNKKLSSKKIIKFHSFVVDSCQLLI